MRNCRCCFSSYEKDPERICDTWCILPIVEFNYELQAYVIQEPKGFCEFCDKNNKRWYIDDPEWHKIKQPGHNPNSRGK